jgi:hypothetical protein
MARFLVLVLCLADLSVASVPFWFKRPRLAPTRRSEPELTATPTEAPPRFRQSMTATADLPPQPKSLYHVHGRITRGDDELEADVQLAMVVRDGNNEWPVEVNAGRYAVTLAAGTYCFALTAPAFTAESCDIRVGPDEDEEIDLVLDSGPVIAGQLHVSDDVSVTITAVPMSESEPAGSAFAQGPNKFEINGLVAGAHYQVRASAPGYRTQVLPDVEAPARNLDFTLSRAPVLRGGFGVPRGEPCPLDSVRLYEVEEDETTELAVDRFCRFESHPLSDETRVRLIARGSEGDFDLWVDIPSVGDPPFVCLRGPCRGPEPDDFSSLDLDIPDAQVDHWGAVFVDGKRYGQRGLRAMHFDDLPSREEAVLVIHTRRCSLERHITLQPGANRLSLSESEICQASEGR